MASPAITYASQVSRDDSIGTVRAACRIMLSLDPFRPLTVRDAAVVAGCSASAAHRLLGSLHAGGFALQDERGQYRSVSYEYAVGAVDTRAGELRAVHKALMLLREMAGGRVLSVKEASELLEVSPSTAFRLLKSLWLEKMVAQLPDRRYRSGPGLKLHRTRPGLAEVLEVAIPIASEVGADTGETVHLWKPAGPFVQLVHAVRGVAPDAVSHDRWPRVPAYSTAGGRTILANLSNAVVDVIHKDGLPPWRISNIKNLRTLKQRLSLVRRRGYDTNSEEGAQGVSGLAACANDSLQQPLIALGIALPSNRFSSPVTHRYRDVLEESKRSMEKALA